jgi:hypothetical protein
MACEFEIRHEVKVERLREEPLHFHAVSVRLTGGSVVLADVAVRPVEEL